MSSAFPASSRPPGPRSFHGFSLVELLVAVTLIGIAAGLSLPKINKIQNQTKIQRATRAVSQDIQQAFAIAGRNRAPVKLTWSSSTMQLRITNMAGSTIYRRLGLGDGGGYGFSSSEVSVIPATLVVFPNGLAADTLVIQVARNGYSKTVRVSKSGMVRLQ
jgi:prepilin-type N-terminal cleavage/methylation domain-containing protein